MINDIRELTANRPFVPLTIHLVDGGGVYVPTVDHVHIAPSPERVFVRHDNGKYDTIRPLMISRVTVDGQTASPSSWRSRTA